MKLSQTAERDTAKGLRNQLAPHYAQWPCLTSQANSFEIMD